MSITVECARCGQDMQLDHPVVGDEVCPWCERDIAEENDEEARHVAGCEDQE